MFKAKFDDELIKNSILGFTEHNKATSSGIKISQSLKKLGNYAEATTGKNTRIQFKKGIKPWKNEQL